jgi:hypothetical protein
MIKGRIERESTGDEGTFGRFIFPKLTLHSLELPWRGNSSNISCIPAGVYLCVIGTMSRTVGGRRRLYRILNVPGRAGVFIHAGNKAGDRSKGFKSDSLGCPLLGTHRGLLGGQRAVLGSKTAITMLMEYMQDREFELTVSEE